MQKFGKPRDINTKAHTYTHNPSWNTQAPFVLHSSRLLALASALSLALHLHIHGNFLLLLSAELLAFKQLRRRLWIERLAYRAGALLQLGGERLGVVLVEVKSQGLFVEASASSADSLLAFPAACPPSFVRLVFSL